MSLTGSCACPWSKAKTHSPLDPSGPQTPLRSLSPELLTQLHKELYLLQSGAGCHGRRHSRQMGLWLAGCTGGFLLDSLLWFSFFHLLVLDLCSFPEELGFDQSPPSLGKDPFSVFPLFCDRPAMTPPAPYPAQCECSSALAEATL